MVSLLNSLMVLCVMGVLGMMGGVEGAPPPQQEKPGKHTPRKPTKHAGAEAETVPLFLDPNHMVPTLPVRPIHQHSISPWTYNNTHHSDLFPSTISEATCSLRGCRDKAGREDLDVESKPILHQILVLRRVGQGSQAGYHYRLETRVISVGCTCVTPSFQLQQ